MIPSILLTMLVSSAGAAPASPPANVFVDREARKIDPAGHGWKVDSDTRLWPGVLAGLRLF